MTLVDFLLARIAEDEADARAASPGPWSLNPDDPEQVMAVDGIEVVDAFALSGSQTRSTAAHIARHDPSRVLAECGAMREIVGLHPEMLTICQGCANESWPCRTLYAVAQPYRDHPDFDPAWAS